MKRNLLRVAFVALALTSAHAVPALAGLPAIFDRVPAEATVVLVTQNLDELDKGVADLLAASGLPPLGTPSALLERIGLNKGIDMSRPLAIALMPGDLEGDTPPAVIFIPTNNFAAMMDALDAEEDGDLYTFVVDTGETLFARAGGGGYAIVGPMRETVAAVDGHGGNLAAHESHIGSVGARLSEDSHFSVVVKKPMLDLLQEFLAEKVKSGIDDIGEQGEDAEQLQLQAEQAAQMIQSMFGDATDIVLGIRADETGLSFDLAVDFDPDSEFGDLFDSAGDSSKYLGKLPNQPFLFAYAGDYATPAIGKVFAMLASLNDDMHLDGAMEFGFIKKMLDLAQGQAVAVFVNPGGLMGGLLANTISYSAAKDPNALLLEIRKVAEQMNGQAGLDFNYEPDATEVDGVSADRYSISMNPGEDGGPLGGMMVQQAVAMLFGPSGISGYYAPGKAGVYQTLSKKIDLLRDALAAEDGQNPLTNNPLLASVSQRLPRQRTFEMYLGIQSVVEQALQTMAIFGMQMDVDVPPQLAPIGVAGTTAESAGRISAFVPSPVIKMIAQIATQAQQMFGGGGDFDDDNDGNDAPPF